MSNNNFRFWLPLDKLEKAVDPKTGKRVMKVGGIASTARKDTDGESLNASADGFDLSYLQERGIINWNHSKAPEAVIGEPTTVKFTKKGLYVESELYSDSDLANKVYDLAETLNKNSRKRKLGYSIEGKVVERDPTDEKIVKKAMITNIALTINPKNADSLVDIIKGEFCEIPDEELYKNVPSDPIKDFNEKVANGGEVTYLVDITKDDGSRITVDQDYNIRIDKCLTTETGKAVIKEDVDGKLKDQQSTLTKAAVFEKIFNQVPVISFEKANEIFETLNSLTMKNTKTSITDDILNKALGTLGISGQPAKAAEVIKKGEGTEKGTEEGEEGEEEKPTEKKKEIKKSVETAPAADPELKELIKSLAIVNKGSYDLLKSLTETVTAQGQRINEMESNLKKSLDDLDENLSQPVKKAVVKATPVAREFAKGVNDELGNNAAAGSGKPQLSIAGNKAQIVNLLDEMAFEKGFNNELATAMTLFESSSQLNNVGLEALKTKGYEIIN